MKKYYYKEGTFTERDRNGHYGWKIDSWAQTGVEIEVSKEFYYNFLLPEEERIVKEKGSSRTFHHAPFIKESN